MNQNELMHYGTKGMHWYERNYQNHDGSLTPEGRIHYGVGPARSKVTGTAENTHKKPDKQEKETGYEKLKKSAQAITKQAKEGYNAAKKEASERAAKIYEDAKKRAQEAAERREEKRRLEEERKEQEEKEKKERRALGDRSNKWREYDDAELQAHTNRKRLEDAANDAAFAAKIQKVDRFRQLAAEANNYLKTGLDLYDNYKKLQVILNPDTSDKTPKETYSSTLSKEVLGKIADMNMDDIVDAYSRMYVSKQFELAAAHQNVQPPNNVFGEKKKGNSGKK